MKFKSKKVISSTLVTSAVCPVFLEAQTCGGAANAVNTPVAQVFSGSKLRALSGSAEGNVSFYVLVGAIVVVVGFSALFYFLKKYLGESDVERNNNFKEQQIVDEEKNNKPFDKISGADVEKKEDTSQRKQSVEGKYNKELVDEKHRLESELEKKNKSLIMKQSLLFNGKQVVEKLQNLEKENGKGSTGLKSLLGTVGELNEEIQKLEKEINVLKEQLEKFGNEGEQLDLSESVN